VNDRTSRQPLLRLHDVEVGYGSDPVLAGVDWEVRAGEFWFLLGPNGSGKTTLLRAILGLLPPRRGMIERDPERAARSQIGFVPQRCDIATALPTTVREVVGLGLVGVPLARGDRRARLAEAFEQTGLVGLERRSLASLSGGQRQRALVARALVRRPALLILDEPTESLDVASEEGFLEVVEALHRAHDVAVLFVTHRLAIATHHASHLALAYGGGLAVGPTRAVLAHPNAFAAFGPALAAFAGAAR
jgi:ABC-type Mn2+/Zn2+ transport system ATPase subunit